MQNSLTAFLENHQEIISGLEKEVMELEMDVSKIEQDKQNFFQNSVALAIQKKLCNLAQAVDKTSLWEIRRDKKGKKKKGSRLLEIDGLCRVDEPFSIETELVNTPLQFICKIGQETVSQGEFLFIEATMSDDENKIRNDIEKYHKIFQQYTLKADRALIFPNRAHLIVVFDKSLKYQERIKKVLTEVSFEFKSITIFYCDFKDIVSTWGNEKLTQSPPNIYSYLEKTCFQFQDEAKEYEKEKQARIVDLEKTCSELQEKVKEYENLALNHVDKTGVGHWESRLSHKPRFSL